jgi:hypothetical protein
MTRPAGGNPVLTWESSAPAQKRWAAAIEAHGHENTVRHEAWRALRDPHRAATAARENHWILLRGRFIRTKWRNKKNSAPHETDERKWLRKKTAAEQGQKKSCSSHENQSKKRETTLSENRQIEEPRRDYGTEKLARPKTGRQNKRKVNHVALVSKESVSKDENQFADKAWTFITAHKEHE